MKKDFVCQGNFDHRIWSALPIIVRVMAAIIHLLNYHCPLGSYIVIDP
jgi:hypothetical protein